MRRGARRRRRMGDAGLRRRRDRRLWHKNRRRIVVAGVVVGAFIGWALDRWLDTSPLFMLVMFFMGAIAGMLNVWRVFTGRGLAAGYFDEHKTSSDKDD